MALNNSLTTSLIQLYYILKCAFVGNNGSVIKNKCKTFVMVTYNKFILLQTPRLPNDTINGNRKIL